MKMKWALREVKKSDVLDRLGLFYLKKKKKKIR